MYTFYSIALLISSLAFFSFDQNMANHQVVFLIFLICQTQGFQYNYLDFAKELESIKNGDQDLEKMQKDRTDDFGTPKWNKNVFDYFIRLKQSGKQLGNNVFVAKEMNGHQNVICKLEPYNRCYKMANDGQLTLLGRQQRPVRFLRVY